MCISGSSLNRKQTQSYTSKVEEFDVKKDLGYD